MSLASTQAAVDSAMSSVLSSIASAQDTYLSTYGKYFAGTWSNNNTPADGSATSANNLSTALPCYAQTWTGFGVNPGSIACNIKITAYQTPTQLGYLVSTSIIYSGAFYTKVVDVSGGASAVAVAWQSTADPFPPSFPAPTYSSVSPSSGSSAGGTSITISGTGFQNSATVTLGGNACTSVSVSADGTSITCTTPSGSSGAQNLVITNLDNQSVTGSSAFTYTASYSMINTLSSGTSFTWPSWLSGSPQVEIWGTGGGGAGANSNGGGGGGGGAYCKKVVTASANDVVTYAIGGGGGGGTAGNDGTNGGNSSCSTYSLTANGGAKGLSVGTGGAGGGASGGDVNTSGTSGSANASTSGGAGGAGANGGAGGSGGTSGNGVAGTAPGGGGGGGGGVGIDYDGASGGKGQAKFSCNDPSQVTFVQSGTGTADGTSSLSISLSRTPYQGSLLIAVIQTNAGSSITPLQSGWTQIQSGTNAYQCFYKLVDAITGASGTFDWGGATKSDHAVGVMIEVYGTAATAIDATAASTGTASSPSVTTTVANALVVSCAVSSTSTDYATQPTGWTLGPRATSSGVAAIAYKTFASAGATGTAAWNAGGTKVFTVAVKPS